MKAGWLRTHGIGYIMLGIFLMAALLLLLIFKGEKTLHEVLFPKLYGQASFPDTSFLPMQDTSFVAQTRKGFRAMKQKRAVLCALARDNAATLPLTIQRLEATGKCFAQYHVVIYENDSTDQTPEILQAWAAENPNVTLISESLVGHPILKSSRTERMAHFRNRYLEHIRDTPHLRESDILIVADLDLAGGWSLSGMAWGFAATDWDGLIANSIGYHYMRRTYYDTYALEPKRVLNQNWMYRLVGEAWQFKPGSPLVPVESGFGGLGVYRMDAILPREYTGRLRGREVCEHTGLNADGRLKFYLNPSQIALTGSQGWNEAPRKGFGRMRRVLCNW